MAQPLNVLLLLTDQQRWDTLGIGGNRIIRTPVLDDLCRRGVRFTDAYTPSPVCVPARYSLLTGRLPHRNGCFDNGSPMSRSLPTMMSVLAEAGYQTCGVGKMHFSPTRHPFGFHSLRLSEEIPRHPDEDEFLQHLQEEGYAHVHEPHGIRSEHYYIPQVSQLPARLHTTAWTADESIAFLRERDRTRPFFLWTSFIKPHPPFDPPVPWNKLYRTVDMPLPHRPESSGKLQTWWMRHQNRYKYRDGGPDDNLVRTIRAAYYASISFIDYHIGRILDALEDSGELERTLILFASDHGELLGDYGSWGKRAFLDSAARVPLIATCPEILPADRTCSRLASLHDIMPTALEAAGVQAEELDGESLVRLADDDVARSHLLGQMAQEARGVYMAMTDDYKYFYSAADHKEFLFRRSDRQPEAENLAVQSGYGQILQEHRVLLLDRFRRDGYFGPVADTGTEWRRFDPPAESENPDDDRIFQDARWVNPRLDVPGYS